MNNQTYATEIPLDEDTVRNLVNQSSDKGSNYRTLLKMWFSPFIYLTTGFASGNIDNYVVFLHMYEQVAPHHYTRHEIPWMRDYQLMSEFQQGMNETSAQTVWDDFLAVYNHTHADFDYQNDWVFTHLQDLAQHYPAKSVMPIMLAIAHLSMISEFKYRRKTGYGVKSTYLGKAVKFIGSYQAIVLGWNTHKVANFSRHRNKYWLMNVYRHYRQQSLAIA